jgi:hypothetical protein
VLHFCGEGGEGGGDALITPGLALTVRAALDINDPHISSARYERTALSCVPSLHSLHTLREPS